jgi:hypothetical protein
MIQAARALAAAVFLLVLPASMAQSLVSEIKLHTDPAEAKVRPLESIVVQLLAYSEIDDGSGGKKKVRVQPASEIRFTLKDDGSGWLSKPFRFQGQESEGFYEPEGSGLAAIIFRRATSQYVRQDSALYTAPAKTGKYEIKAELDGKTATLDIEVDSNAPALRVTEKTRFPAESSSPDPYRRLAEHYAPFIAQETWFQPKSDYLARFDLDGDWQGDNNWENAESGSSQAYVHYAAMETDTHWFLIYNFFHPRDYSDKCVAGTCHENDNEGMILTIEKDGSPFGRLLAMETLAHNNVYSHRGDSRVQSAVHNLDGEIELYEGSHPVVFIESGGHGVYGSLGGHATFALRSGEFTGGTGVTYVYKGKAERPRYGNDRLVGYELLPIYDHWWVRSNNGEGRRDRMFDEYYQYIPFGGRPTPREREISGAFYGRMHSSNKARPFWGWFDSRTLKQKVVATGQWALDPAYAVSQNLRMPRPFSLNYVFNPYLGIGEAAVGEISRAQPGEAPPAGATPAGAPAAAPSSGAAGLDVASSDFRPKHSSDYNPGSNSGQFDLRFYVDLSMEISVQGDLVRYRFEGQRPRDDGSEYSQPIPRAAFSRFELEQKDGRGEIVLLERPSPENDYTAKIRITDSRGGDDRYHARLSWESTAAAPAAGAASTTPVAATSGAAGTVATGTGAAGAGAAGTGAAGTAAPGASPPGRSQVLSKHIEDLLNTPPGAETAATPASGTDNTAATAPGAAALPGVELFSSGNDPSRYNNSSEGVFEFRGRVDGAVLFRIRGDRIFAEAESGGPAEVERFSFSQPLPSGSIADVTVEQHDGRGKVVLLERPWQGNGFTAVVRVSDPSGGDDRYHFRLQWRR